MSPLSSSSVRWAQRHTAIQLSSPPTTKPLVKARISRAGRPARTAPKGHSMWETKYGTCLGMGIFWKDWDSLGCWFVEMWIKGRIWMYGCFWCMFETCWKLRLFKNKREMLWYLWSFFICDSYSSFCGSTIGQRKCFAVSYSTFLGTGGEEGEYKPQNMWGKKYKDYLRCSLWTASFHCGKSHSCGMPLCLFLAFWGCVLLMNKNTPISGWFTAYTLHLINRVCQVWVNWHHQDHQITAPNWSNGSFNRLYYVSMNVSLKPSCSDSLEPGNVQHFLRNLVFSLKPAL